MRILYVEGAVGFGGSLTGLLELLAHLPADVEPMLVTRYDVSPFIPMEGLRHQQLNIPEFPKNSSGRWRGLYLLYRYDVQPWAKQLRSVVRSFRPDIIHANNSVGANLGIGVFGRRMRIPVISHQKGYDHLGPMVRAACKYGLFNHHIATSHAMANHLFEAGLPRSRCTMIYDALQPPDFEPVPTGNDIPVVAIYSMLLPWKGQDVFLKAVAKARTLTNIPFRAIVAGQPPEKNREGSDYEASLHRLAQDLKISDMVEFVGHQRNIYHFLKGVDVAVHASVQPEPFGRVGAEAMICSVPVIVTNGGGIAEYVEHGRAGHVVPMGDPEKMAESIAELVSHPKKRTALGQAGRQYALETFQPARIVNQVLDVYRRVLEKT